jgi:endoglucanase
MPEAHGFAPNHIPRVCGFNLLEKFSWRPEKPTSGPFNEWDFDFMARHGFAFARLPMDYRVWTRDLAGARRDIDAGVLAEIAAAVEMGKQRGIHVCVNIHRASGYCINRPEDEPYNLWIDPSAQETFARHWRALAEAVKAYSSDECSLDLLNEPPGYGQLGFTPESHRKAMGMAVAAIREVSPGRLIICDGGNVGNTPATELEDLNVAQSTRGYAPWQVTHYKASWLNRPADYVWQQPAWPMEIPREDGEIDRWDKARLREHYRPWRELAARGAGVHCGELGVFNQTPPAVAQAFLDDLLSVLGENGWGWALWNLRGSFGPIDNGRAGVATENCDGHQLDRRMLELLKHHAGV